VAGSPARTLADVVSSGEFDAVLGAVTASVGGLDDLDVVWSATYRDHALLVLRRASDGSELAALSSRSDGTWNLISVEGLWFLPYDGSSKPFRRHGHNPLGVAVHGVTMQPGVSSCRVGDPERPIEEAVVGGRWYRCLWDIRPWGASWEWPPVRELKLNRRWVAPVTSHQPMTLDFLLGLVLEPDSREEGWQIVDSLVGDDPGVAWTVMVELADTAGGDEGFLRALGAGPLENWFEAVGDQYFDLIEREARRSPSVALALRGVWAYDAPARGRLDDLLTEVGVPPGPLG
jgi:uncharacterized protein DUF6869